MDRYARIVFALLVTSMVVITAALASARGGHAQIGTAVHAHVDPDSCRYSRSDGRRGWTPDEVRRTIRCTVNRWPVPGGLTQALSVAACESGFSAKAYNPGGYAGVYQQAVRYWDSRRRAFDVPYFDLKPSVFNGRTNVVISIRMARGGWGAWGCA